MTAIDNTLIATTSYADPTTSADDLSCAPLTLEGVDWGVAAACRTVPNAADLFFSDEFPDIRAAKLICAECPVMAPCLEEAFGRAEPCGVWGGQLFEDGRIVTIKRKRGRPPKHPRPEDQLPIIPIPEHLASLVAGGASLVADAVTLVA